MENKTIQALQNVYKSLGGNIDNVLNINNIPDMLLAISTLDIGSTDNINLLSAELEDNEDEEIPETFLIKEYLLMMCSYVYGWQIPEDMTTEDLVAMPISDFIELVATSKEIYNSLNIVVKPETSSTLINNIRVDTFQTNVKFYGAPLTNANTYIDNLIIGTTTFDGDFTEVEGGLEESGRLSGTGYFVALRFYNSCNADKIEVCTSDSLWTDTHNDYFEPEQDSLNYVKAVFKFTDFSEQKISIKVTKGDVSRIFHLFKIKSDYL